MKEQLFLYLLFLSNMFGDIIIHDKVQSAPYGISVPIRVFLNVSETDVHRFSLLYRPFGNIEYVETPMIQMGKSMYWAEIPGDFIKRDFLEYYLLLEMSNQKETFLPTHNAVNNPIRINIDIPEGVQLLENIQDPSSDDIQDFDIVGLNPEVIIISPQPGERILRRDLFIALSYFPIKNIDPSQVKVYIDEIDVSDKADIDSSYLSVPTNAITQGIHTIRVNIANIFGQKYNDISWSFTVLPGEIQSFGVIKKQSSRLWANYARGHVDKSVIDIGEINFIHNVDFDWLLMDTHYSKSTLENKFDQPRNRYYVCFRNEFMKIKLGDSYPLIDNYAWDGRHVRGVHFSFKNGPVSIDVINGKTARAIQGHPADNAMVISAIDSTSAAWGVTISRNNYTFQQDVSAAKMGLIFGEKAYWDFNYIKIQDNIPTVSNQISNAEVVIPDELVSRIKFDDYFTILDTIYTIRFDTLINNITTIFGDNDYLVLPAANWIGTKPKDNFIVGSNLQYGFDDSRILIKSGFSLSFLNPNKWNNINNISELDTLAYDITLDGMFLDYTLLDTSRSISKYEPYFNFGRNGQPLIPFMLKKDAIGVKDFLNLSYLNRYSKLQLRYLGHSVELGSKRNGPIYYSLLNPSLKTNYTENYFSDRLNLFHNKLLLYYKRSNITEGLFTEQTNPIKIRKSLFNIALYPGTGLPTFNFSFISSNRDNGIKNFKTVVDTIQFNYNGTGLDTILYIISDTLDNRIEQVSKQFNISMTNQFQLWVNQVLSVYILLVDLKDKVAQNVRMDDLLSIRYLPKDATSESYGISLKSVYNRHWESIVYFNTSYYDYGLNEFDYDDEGVTDYQKQLLRNNQFKLAYRPEKYISKLIYGLHYSTVRGANYITQYNFNIGIFSELIDKIKLNIFFDYRIKYLGQEMKSDNEIFFRVKLEYDIK